MLRRLSATPCPTSDNRARRESILSISDDTTANLDFTTEFKASFRDVKPKRPPTAAKRRAPIATPWTIHEDEELKVESDKKRTDAVSSDQHVAGAQGPRHPHRRVSLVRADNSEHSAPSKHPQFATKTTLSKAPRRLSIHPPNPYHESEDNETIQTLPVSRTTKPARRGTVYIPSDDTTVPTMFMDIFSPLRRAPPEPGRHCDQDADLTGLAMQMMRRKGPRKSMLSTSPKRVPLQPSVNTPASNVIHDQVGQGPGKENIPPGVRVANPAGSDKPTHRKRPKAAHASKAPSPRLTQTQQSRLYQPTSSSTARTNDKHVSKKKKEQPAWNSNFLLPKLRRSLQPTSESGHDDAMLPKEPRFLADEFMPRRTIVPCIQSQVIQEYPFLPEGLVDVSMYEENWLGQQEIAMTQLINNLFDEASPTSRDGGHDDLHRLRIAEAYGSSSMAVMYKRLQGALVHGALGISPDVLEQGYQLHADLGRRKSYTNFWLTNYNPKLLQSCLEVVVGRTIPIRTSEQGRQSPHSSDISREQRSMQRFIEKFLIRNEDFTASRKSDHSTARLYQRTVLRSLMLVKLLDMIKSESCLKSKSTLFLRSSDQKSSEAAVNVLFNMLNPSSGDPTRALRALGYSVSHVQYPLEEFEYGITNLAVDLRDGVRLTRLVELLLYRSASQSLGHAQDAEATTTITVPSGHTIVLGDGNQDWPLSQHLKVPCGSRATKLYNVQLALAALKEVKGMAGLLQDIDASSIVDGFREKTVRLLWGLSSKWGLGGLVDWEDVKAEIRRLGRSRGHIGHLYLEEFDLEEDEEGYLQFKNLLKAWVKAVAASHGLRVRNFTSDFADGRLFGALVSEYQPFLTSFGHGEVSRSLPDQLRALGCSDEFGRLFAPSEAGVGGQQIFDRDFVLASLAFLCSRLLRPSKRARAAVSLQRAWRKRWEGVALRRKAALKGLAVDCAELVRIREAKVCIWRAWCKFQAERNRARAVGSSQTLEEDVWLSI